MSNLRRTRRILTTSMAMAVLGCQAPGVSPAIPATNQQAESYPGTVGHVFPQESTADATYSLAATAKLAVTTLAASANAATVKNARDGNLATTWGSGNVVNPSMTLTLAADSALASLALKVNPVGTYDVEVSSNGTTWTPVLKGQRNSSWNVETKTFPPGTQGRYVKLNFVNGGQQVMVFEVDVNGSAALPTPAPTLLLPTVVSKLVSTVATSAGSATAKNAQDGNLATTWGSGNVANPSMTLSLAAESALASLAIKVNPIGTYSIEVSNDGTAWTTALTNQRNTSWNIETKTFPTGTRGRFVKLNFANGGQQVMVFEVAVNGGAAGGATLPTTPPSTATAAPTPAPTAAPTVAPTAPPIASPTNAPNGPTITVNTGTVLHKADSHILGTNRNHVPSDFKNGAAKLAKLRDLQPTWGGSKYLYRVGHGPTDGRNDYDYMTGFHFEQLWGKNSGYPYDDIRNALGDAATLGADQMHVVNFGTSDPEEAGRYVSYLNKKTDANRVNYPIAQQNVQLFELGNEIPWSMVRGHDKYAATDLMYAARAKQFAQKMRANSDVPIKIGAVASINSNWQGNGWAGGKDTVKNILSTMGSDVDFLIYHGYPSWPLYKTNDLMTLMAQNEWNRIKLETEIKPAIKQYANGRDVFIANTEFFAHIYNDPTRARGLYGALYAADTLTLAFNQDIRTAVEFCFDHKEMADAAFFINDDPNNTTAIFKFQQMLAKHWGDQVVATSSANIPTVNVAGSSTNVSLPRLAYTAATTGNRTYVMVTNRLDDAAQKATINVGFTPKAVTAYTLTDGAGWSAANATVSTKSGVNLANYDFAKSSVTIFEIDR